MDITHPALQPDLPAEEDRLSIVVKSAGLGTWDWDIQSGELVWSRTCLEMFGLPPDTRMSYALFLEAVHPDDRERIEQAVKRALDHPEEYSVEMRSIWPDGSVHWIASRGRAYFNEAGQAIRMTGAAMDVTGLKETEEQLRRVQTEVKAQADNLAAVIDAVPGIVFFSEDRECRRMSGSRFAYELFGLPRGTNVSMSAPLEERPNHKVLENGIEVPAEDLPMQRAARTGREIRDRELEVRTSDGKSILMYGHAVPLFDDTGEVRGAIGAYLDISDRKLLEERLQVTSERFQVALRGTPITVFNQGLDLRYKWMFNPGRGYRVAEIIGKRDSDFLERPEDAAKIEAIKTNVMRTGRSFRDEVVIHHDGEPRTYHITIEPQRDAHARIIGLTAASFDLTERKRWEAERKVSELALRESERQLALEATAMIKLNDWSLRLWRSQSLDEGMRLILATAIELVGADKGNFQIYDAERNVLTIAAQQGFDEDFLIFFKEVPSTLDSACGRALRSLDRIIIEDVEADGPFAPFRAAAREAQFRAVIATPLVATDGTPVGVVSTHFRDVHRPTEQELARLDLYMRQAIDFIHRFKREDALRASEARYRDLAENLDREVQARTQELQIRNDEITQTSDGLRALSGRLLRIQDEERRRVARDLHDSAGQIVTALDLELSDLATSIRAVAPELARKAEQAEALVQQLHRELRTTSYLLHPPLLDEAGLHSALTWYVQGLSDRSGIKVELEIAERFGRLPRDIEIAIFRLVQESLTNIHRHSGSNSAVIHVERSADDVRVEVHDKGKGIPPERLVAIQSGGSGVGIRGMQERLRQLRGELKIESGAWGTRVVATIPLPPDPGTREESGSQRLQKAL